jgi:hypothetical protein
MITRLEYIYSFTVFTKSSAKCRTSLVVIGLFRNFDLTIHPFRVHLSLQPYAYSSHVYFAYDDIQRIVQQRPLLQCIVFKHSVTVKPSFARIFVAMDMIDIDLFSFASHILFSVYGE